MSSNIANLFARKFIARPDAKAEQQRDGKWHVHTTTRKKDDPRIPWRREDLEAHLAGQRTYGHYLLSTDSSCKLFAFDVDLEKVGSLPTVPFEASVQYGEEWYRSSFYQEEDLRAAWLNRTHPARDYMKLQFKELAHMLMRGISEELELPCAAAYSGGKGVHVYAFTGLISAVEAREGAQIVLDSVGKFKPLRGDNFFKPVDYENLSVEVFPKQGNLDGKDLGNLMRMPLGKNLKAPQEPTFFIDMTSPLGQMVPVDAEYALTTESPWK